MSYRIAAVLALTACVAEDPASVSLSDGASAAKNALYWPVEWSSWSPSGAIRTGGLGGVGDVDGDGYDDVALGMTGLTDGETYEGGADIFLGSATGPSTSADFTLGSDVSKAYAGHNVAHGDVNGDGYSDVVLGAPFYTGSVGTYQGAVFVYFGGASGPSTSPDVVLEGDVGNMEMGMSLDVGDANGDGYADIAVGAPNYANGDVDEGAVYVYEGSASGPSTSPDWRFEPDAADWVCGYGVALDGDADGDGYADLAIACPWAAHENGVVLAFRGGTGGLAALPALRLQGHTVDQFGWGSHPLVWADVDGDGLDDILATSGTYGRIGVWLAASGFATRPDVALFGATNGYDSYYTGDSLASVGDLDGDGYDDLLAGKLGWWEDGYGAVFAYTGSASGPASLPVFRWNPGVHGANFWYYGATVAAAGDVDADGYADALVSDNYDYTITLLKGRHHP